LSIGLRVKLNGFDIEFKENIIKTILNSKLPVYSFFWWSLGFFGGTGFMSCRYNPDTGRHNYNKENVDSPCRWEGIYLCLSIRYFLGIGYSFVSRL